MQHLFSIINRPQAVTIYSEYWNTCSLDDCIMGLFVTAESSIICMVCSSVPMCIYTCASSVTATDYWVLCIYSSAPDPCAKRSVPRNKVGVKLRYTVASVSLPWALESKGKRRGHRWDCKVPSYAIACCVYACSKDVMCNRLGNLHNTCTQDCMFMSASVFGCGYWTAGSPVPLSKLFSFPAVHSLPSSTTLSSVVWTSLFPGLPRRGFRCHN